MVQQSRSNAAATGGRPISIRDAAMQCDIKANTLRDRLKDPMIGCRPVGRPQICDPSDIDDVCRKAEEENQADRTMSHGQINSLLAMVAQHKGVLAPGRGLSKPTKAKAKKEIASRGFAISHGRSTSMRRNAARDKTEEWTNYFDAIAAEIKQYPELGKEPGRILVYDEKPSHPCTEKKRSRRADNKLVFDPKTNPNSARTTSLNNGYKNISGVSAALGDGRLLPNAYIPNGKFLQWSLFTEPYPPGITRESLQDLCMAISDNGLLNINLLISFQ